MGYKFQFPWQNKIHCKVCCAGGISRLLYFTFTLSFPASSPPSLSTFRIQHAKSDGAQVVDVDGSYLYRKEQNLIAAGVITSPVDLPEPPVAGWEQLKADNHTEFCPKIPQVTPGVCVCMCCACVCACVRRVEYSVASWLFMLGILYTYLAKCVGNSVQQGAFRALKSGYIRWSSGCLDSIEVSTHHCHVRCKATPSMKAGVYHVYVLLKQEGYLASTSRATC